MLYCIYGIGGAYMKYYLKKCGHQELGSVKDGKKQRGRYFLTSMNHDVLSFFPSLSTTQLNDYALLPIVPMYLNKKVYCSFVYHNDKFHNSQAKQPRNEYRIYLNKELEMGKLFFETEDIVIMRSEEVIVDETTTQVVYFLEVVKDKTSNLYTQCDEIINEYPIKGGYGLFEGRIDEFEDKVDSYGIINDTDVSIDSSVTNRIKETEEESSDAVADLFNSATFRDFVIVGYEKLCAVSGTVIRYDNFMNLEAAHIKPKSHGGKFLPSNGLALCRDLHWAFDKGFFTLSDDYRVIIHPRINSDYLKKYDGKEIRKPKDLFFLPSSDNIRYHRENVYGLFLRTGKL